MTTRYCYTTGEQGYRVGTDYSDSISTADLGQAAICRVVVGYDSYITSLTVYPPNLNLIPQADTNYPSL